MGLSPRVRGNQRRSLVGRPRQRSIPACAGEPQPSHSKCRHRKVYPRVCGGTLEQNKEPVSAWGLSPRVRGNLRAA